MRINEITYGWYKLSTNILMAMIVMVMVMGRMTTMISGRCGRART